MTAALIGKSHQEYHSKESGTYLSGFTNDISQMEQLGWEPFLICLVQYPRLFPV